MEKITIKPYLKPNGSSIKVAFYVPKEGFRTISEICEHMLDGGRVEFDLSSLEKQKKFGKTLKIRQKAASINFERDILLSIAENIQKNNGKATQKELENIIKKGGFINYIMDLENRLIQKGISVE